MALQTTFTPTSSAAIAPPTPLTNSSATTTTATAPPKALPVSPPLSGTTTPASAPKSPTVVSTAQPAQNKLATITSNVNALSQGVNQQVAKKQAAAAVPVNPAVPAAPAGTQTAAPNTPQGNLVADSSLPAGYVKDQSGQIFKGVPTPATSAPAASSTPPAAQNGAPAPAATTPAQDDYTTQINDLNAKTDAAFKSYQDSMGQLQNGTFPLTQDQQAQVQAMTDSFAQMKVAQQNANDVSTTRLRMAGESRGRNMSAPEVQASLIKGSVDQGLAKIREIDTKMQDAITTLKAGFADKNYKMVNDMYSQVQNFMKAKTDTLTTMQKTVQDHADKIQAYNLEVQKQLDLEQKNQADEEHQQLQDRISSASLSLTQARDLANQAVASGNLDLNKQKHLDDLIQQKTTNTLDQARLDLERQKEGFTESQAADPFGLAGNPQSIGTLVDTGIASKLSDGSTYLDVSQFSDSKQKSAAEKLARQAGIPVISSSKDIDELTKVDTVEKNLQLVQSLWKQVAPKDAGARLQDMLTQWASKGADTAEGQFVQAYSSLAKIQGPSLVQALGGTSRVNTNELSAYSTALPSIDPKNMDTVADATLKFKDLTSMLNNSKSSLLDNKRVFADIDSFANSLTPEQKSVAEKKYDDMKKDGGSDEQILLLLQRPQGASTFNQPLSMGGKGSSLAVANPNPSKVIGGYDFSNYATDPNWGNSVRSIINKTPDVSTPEALGSYISQKSPNSPFADNPQPILTVANQAGIDPKLFTAIVQHESLLGTSKIAMKNNNYSGITWNGHNGEKGSARPANEGGYYVKYSSPEEGLMALANNINKRHLSSNTA